MLDWTKKKLVRKYHYTNIGDDRKCIKSVNINGRLYDKHGVDCATTMVALEYKVYDPSVKRFKTAILCGIARQNPGDIVLVKELGIEIATTNAMIEPIMVLEYPKPPSERIIYYLMSSYVLGLPIQFVKTATELKNEGKDIRQYSRDIRKDYYSEYYKDLKKYLWNSNSYARR